MIINFNKYIMIKALVFIIVKFSRKRIFFDIVFSWYVSCRDERIIMKTL